MIEGNNRYLFELEKIQRARIMREALISRMAGCIFDKKLRRTGGLFLAIGRYMVATGMKLQSAAQIEIREIVIPRSMAD